VQVSYEQKKACNKCQCGVLTAHIVKYEIRKKRKKHVDLLSLSTPVLMSLDLESMGNISLPKRRSSPPEEHTRTFSSPRKNILEHSPPSGRTY
jgi:hypothetical protein